ncbi:MAG: hypothetical protein LBU34_11325 [Planctomycetaceae bacterium]|nr:hypothetical protein [Planctomycetaceae bacterium]
MRFTPPPDHASHKISPAWNEIMLMLVLGCFMENALLYNFPAHDKILNRLRF